MFTNGKIYYKMKKITEILRFFIGEIDIRRKPVETYPTYLVLDSGDYIRKRCLSGEQLDGIHSLR